MHLLKSVGGDGTGLRMDSSRLPLSVPGSKLTDVARDNQEKSRLVRVPVELPISAIRTELS